MDKTTNRRMVSAAIMVSILLVAIDTTIVTTAMPHIVKQLSGLKLISWVFAIYLLTTAITTPIYGKLADMFGRKPVFLIGIVLFVIGSMLSGAAQSMTQLIWFRAFQGIGAGAVIPLSITIFGDLYTGEDRGRMQGLVSSVWAFAGLLGPLAGGLFVDYISWRWIFYVNVPVGIIATLLIVRFFQENPLKHAKKDIDYLGAALFTIAIGSLLFALISGGESYPWNSGVIISLFITAFLFLGLFLISESRAKNPMLPLSIFKIRVIAISNIVGFVTASVLIGVSVYLPIWIQILLEQSATTSGLVLMPMSLAWPLASTLAGRYMYRIGAKFTVILGTSLVAAGAAWLLMVNTASPYWFFVGIIVLIGLGMGASSTPSIVVIQSAVGWNLRGVATASNTLTRTLGQTVGIAVLGTTFNNSLNNYVQSHIPGGWQGGDISNALMSASNNIAPGVLEQLKNGMAHSLHLVFALVFALAVLALIISIALPSHRAIISQQPAD